jgi:hypothetical protein
VIQEPDEAAEALSPFRSTILECVADAIQQYRQELLVSGALSKRTHSSAINDYMVNNARTRLLALPGVGYPHMRGRHLFTLGDDFTLHLKKLDGMRRSMGILTQQRLQFLEQRHSQLQLPLRDRTFIEGGYSWHDDFRMAFGVYVACPLKNPVGQRISNLWVLRLHGEADASAAAISILPIVPSDQDAGATVLPRIADAHKRNRDIADG